MRLERNKQLTVGVVEGMVELTPRNDMSAATDLHAGQQATLIPFTTISIGILDAGVSSLLSPGQPAKSPKPRVVRRKRVASRPSKRPSPVAKVAPEPEQEAAVAPAPQPEIQTARPADSVHDWMPDLGQEGGWILDSLREEMERGRFEDALRKLNNYLSDPESPNRPEALFLKAVCLERLMRFGDAGRVYRDYLRQWPDGARASEARKGSLRTRKKK
jgi:hypothetical protein